MSSGARTSASSVLDLQLAKSVMTTKPDDQTDDLLPEYDFSKGVRGKYASRFAAGSNVIVLDPELARHFPNAQAVNDALRQQLEARKKAGGV